MTTTETTAASSNRPDEPAAHELVVPAGCRRTERPCTASRYCPACAAWGCARGDGDRVALPLPGDVAAAVDALRRHLSTVHSAEDRQDHACLVCDLASPRCPECEQRPDDMAGEDLDLHTVVEAGTGATAAVAIGCEGYVVAAVRAAALPASAPSAALAPAGTGRARRAPTSLGVAPRREDAPPSEHRDHTSRPIDTTTRGLRT